MSKAVSIIRNRSGVQGRGKRWPGKYIELKKDGHKSANSDLILKDKEPIKVLTLATKGNGVKVPNLKKRS